MKKIVPFNNVLTFNTDVCEITAISLEHDIKTDSDSISGIFYISGEYKMTDGMVQKEKFNFELPFDIALGMEYNLDTLKVDIDDFSYELLENNRLKVNIELSIDGEEKINETSQIDEPSKINIQELDDRKDEVIMDNQSEDLLNEMLDNKNDEVLEITNENNNEVSNGNLFNNFTNEENYVTYRVYRVIDGDTIDNILTKYNITKDEFEKYNSNLELHTGDKLIIPYHDK